MNKKIFFIFTIVMITITGFCFYAIVSDAKVKLSHSRKTDPNPSKQPVPTIVSLIPSPTIFPNENIVPTETQEKSNTEKTLTNNQKYYTSITNTNDINILLIGKDPTYSNHDTIIIACINEENKLVRVIDIPRDIYIDYTDEILKELKDNSASFYSEKGNRKINAAHVVGRMINYSPEIEKFPGKPGINFLSDLIEEVFAIYIDDYIAIETDGFREVVDFFGGVVIDVPIYMHYEDPTQDLYIHLEPGLQLLDGKKAEDFVRFRQGYTRSGKLINYSRTDNTFLFLESFFEQHVNLKNLGKLPNVYDIVKRNTETSVKTINETYEYAKLAKRIIEDDYDIKQLNIKTKGKKTFNHAIYELLKTK